MRYHLASAMGRLGDDHICYQLREATARWDERYTVPRRPPPPDTEERQGWWYAGKMFLIPQNAEGVNRWRENLWKESA